MTKDKIQTNGRVNVFISPPDFLAEVESIQKISRKSVSALSNSAELRSLLWSVGNSDNCGFCISRIDERAFFLGELAKLSAGGKTSASAAQIRAFIDAMHAAATKDCRQHEEIQAAFKRMIMAPCAYHQPGRPVPGSGGWSGKFTI